MASDSQTATAATSEKPLENKVNDEAKLMEKEIVVEETVDVVKDKPVSDSSLTVTKEENINQTPSDEQEKEPHAKVEEVAVVVKAEESTEKGTDGNGEKKVAEQVELKEPVAVSVEEVSVEVADVKKAEEKGKDENGEEKKVAEQVEPKEPTPGVEAGEAEKADGEEKKVVEEVELIKEPTLVKEGVEEVKLETVDVEKAEEKGTVESVAGDDKKDKEEPKVVDVSESTTDEAGGKQVDVQLVREVPEETVEEKIKEVEVLEAEPKASEKVETQPEKANELAPNVEVVKTEEASPETAEQAKVELVGKPEDTIVVETKEPDTAPQKETASSPADVTEKAVTEEKHVVEEPSKDEKASESVSVLCPEKVELTSLENKTEADVTSPADDVTEKAITKEKHVVEEPENASEAKDVATKVEENIKKDDETPAADVKSEAEGTKQEESTPEKAAEVVETAPIVKEIEEPEVTTKEVVVVKPKNTNSIMSKVKKSLVKAKKAIIGKSPSSKTITTTQEEAKEEIIKAK